MKRRYRHSLLLGLILALVFVPSAQAHPADMFMHTHTVSLSPEGIEIVWEVIPGSIIAQSIWGDADSNEDLSVSNAEAQAWVRTFIHTFSAEIDNSPLALDLGVVEWPASISGLISGDESIRIHLHADWPAEIGPSHQISIHNRFSPKNSINWFRLNGEDGIAFDIPEQTRGALYVHFGISDAPGRIAAWESGSPSIPWVVESVGLGGVAEEAAEEAAPGAGSGPTAILEGLIKKEGGSPGFIFTALALAGLLGALHALSPGHGKTIVAAYLVGSQGKFYHAAVLGLIVTLTHTGSVFALGILTLTASRYFFPADVFPILELISGLLILVLGIGLLYPRLQYWISDRRRQRELDKAAVSVPQASGGERIVLNRPIEESGPPHSHDPSEMGFIPKGPVQGDPLAGIQWRSLVTLGVSGGLVPCPDAIAILLIAATINRIAFGLSLIVAFSMGLAAVLIAIGILIVQGKRLFQRLQWFEKASFIMPILSALIVLVAGVILTAGAVQNFTDETSSYAETPTFDLDSAGVIYRVFDQENQGRLYTIPAPGGEPRMISGEANVLTYSIAPDHRAVIFTAVFGTDETRFWQWAPTDPAPALILECPNALCSSVVWSPDGSGILYSRLDLDPETNPSAIHSIWTLDLTTLETAPLFQDANNPGYNPQWSPDGKWISYTSINPLEIKLYNIETGEVNAIPTMIGSPAVWSPTAESLLVVDIAPIGELDISKIFIFDLSSRELRLVDDGQGAILDENYPSWSPDGQWIAVVRREWALETPASGNQIWLMRPDGSESRPVTSEEGIFHGQPVWSPDGQYLLYESFSSGYSGIKILHIETGEITEVAAPGSIPSWLP